MTKLTVSPPVVGTKDSVAEPAVGTALTTIETWANGQIDSSNIKAEGVEGKAVNKEIPKFTGAEYKSKTYSSAEAEAGVEPSATRPSYVSLYFKGKSGETMEIGTIKVGPVTIGEIKIPKVAAETPASTIGFPVPFAVKWSLSGVAGVNNITAVTLVL